MLIDGSLTDTHTAGYLLEGDTVAEVLQDNVTADGRLQLVYALVQGLQFLIEPFSRNECSVDALHFAPTHVE